MDPDKKKIIKRKGCQRERENKENNAEEGSKNRMEITTKSKPRERQREAERNYRQIDRQRERKRERERDREREISSSSSSSSNSSSSSGSAYYPGTPTHLCSPGVAVHWFIKDGTMIVKPKEVDQLFVNRA